jgi:hypothetical protein
MGARKRQRSVGRRRFINSMGSVANMDGIPASIAFENAEEKLLEKTVEMNLQESQRAWVAA